MSKDYDFEIKLVFDNYGIEADTEEKAIEQLKANFYEEFGIKLSDDEITLMEVD